MSKSVRDSILEAIEEIRHDEIVKTWPDPTPEMMESNGFGPIWDAIKSWDIGVPGVYAGYSGATGNHVRAIMDELWRRGFKIVPIEAGVKI